MGKAVNVGAITSETGIIAELNNKRNEMFVRAVTAPSSEEFETAWTQGIEDIMNSGGQDIVDERTQKWEQYYGDAINLE